MRVIGVNREEAQLYDTAIMDINKLRKRIKAYKKNIQLRRFRVYFSCFRMVMTMHQPFRILI